MLGARMAPLRRWSFVVLGMVAASAMSWSAASNSSGAPANSAEAGCTCHNASPSSGVQVQLTVPANYSANQTYEVRIAISGGPMPVPGASQNQGGFALRVSNGTLVAGEGSQTPEDRFATHTAQGNNQRAWTLQWQAPLNATGNVTFWAAGNAVNGDTLNAGGQDQWNRVMVEVPPASGTGGNATMGPSPTDEGSTPLPAGLAFLGAALAVAWRRRR